MSRPTLRSAPAPNRPPSALALARALPAAATAVVVLATVAGCAATTYRDATKSNVTGVRYFAPATYVLVKPDYTNRKASVTFHTLPDTTRLFAADSWSWMAANKTTLEFDKGMIQKSTTEVDTVKVAKAAIEAAAQVGKAALEAAASKAALAAQASGALVSKMKAQRAREPVFLFYSDGFTLVQVYPPTNELTPTSTGEIDAGGNS